MKFSWRTEWPQWLLIAAMFVMAAASWGTAPERIPVHWNLAGQVDRYGGKLEGLLAMPFIALGIYILLLLLPRLDPGRANYPSFAGAYVTVRLAVLALLASLYGFVHLWLRGHEVSIGRWMPLMLGALFIVIGNLLGKVRPNWFFGIRTPWTLSSKRAWTQTHRAGGWVFVAIGLLSMAAGVLKAERAMWIAMALLVVGSVGLAVYSYLVWRADPDKTPPAGTLPAN